jgi:hypothetical protein
MGDDNKRHTGVVRHRLEKRLQCLDPTGGGADADYEMTIIVGQVLLLEAAAPQGAADHRAVQRLSADFSGFGDAGRFSTRNKAT